MEVSGFRGGEKETGDGQHRPIAIPLVGLPYDFGFEVGLLGGGLMRTGVPLLPGLFFLTVPPVSGRGAGLPRLGAFL